jgi:hypothetical protein
VPLRLHFKPGDLLLQESADKEFVLTLGDTVIGTFKKSKPAIAEYSRIRGDLEKRLPPHEATDDEKRQLLSNYIADSLVQHNSLRVPERKPPKSRTFG